MSEKLPVPSPEHHRSSPEHEKDQERQNLKKLQEKAEKASELSGDELQSIKKSIEQAAVSGKEYAVGEKEHRPSQTHTVGTTKQLKQQAYRSTIKKAQSRLKGPEKSFSKVIHNPKIEKVSEVAAKTVARPSGFLLGSISAFITSLVVLYISKRSGFTYNYLLFVLVFVGGYLLGVLVELVLRPLRRR